MRRSGDYAAFQTTVEEAWSTIIDLHGSRTPTRLLDAAKRLGGHGQTDLLLIP
ncbi:MAG: hypothetical protein ABIQ59_10270 [Nocardioidaceae bacterium]